MTQEEKSLIRRALTYYTDEAYTYAELLNQGMDKDVAEALENKRINEKELAEELIKKLE